MADNHDTLDFFGRLENRLALVATMNAAQGQRLDRFGPVDPAVGELCNELGALRVDVAAAVDELRKLARHVAAVEALTIPAAALAQQMQADARKQPADNVVVMRTWPATWADGLAAVDSRRAGDLDQAGAPAVDPHAEALANALRTAGRPDLADRETERLRQRVLASGDLLGYQAGQVSRAELDAKRAALRATELAAELRAGFVWDPVTRAALRDVGTPAVDLSALPGLRDMAEDLAAHLESRWGSDENAMQATELAHGLRHLVDGLPAATDAAPASGVGSWPMRPEDHQLIRKLLELRGQGRLVDAQELGGSDLLNMAELQAQALANLANAPALVDQFTLDEVAARAQSIYGQLRRLVDTDARAAQTPVFMVLGPAYPQSDQALDGPTQPAGDGFGQ